jgi:hypothetical protein
VVETATRHVHWVLCPEFTMSEKIVAQLFCK